MTQNISKVLVLATLLSLSILLASPVQAISYPANSEVEAEPSSIFINLSEQQKDELESMIDDRLERSAAVSDRIQDTVNENFGLLFTLAGLTISALGAIPLFSGGVIFIFRRTILEGIEKTITKELLKTGL